MSAEYVLPEGMTGEKLRKLADFLDTYETLLEQYITAMVEGRRIMPSNADRAIGILRGTEAQADLRKWSTRIDGSRDDD